MRWHTPVNLKRLRALVGVAKQPEESQVDHRHVTGTRLLPGFKSITGNYNWLFNYKWSDECCRAEKARFPDPTVDVGLAPRGLGLICVNQRVQKGSPDSKTVEL